MLLQNRNIVISLPVLKKSQESELAGAIARFQRVREKIAHFQETGEVRVPRLGEWCLDFGCPLKASEAHCYYERPILKLGRELTFADFHIRENQWGIWELLVAGEQIAQSSHKGPLTILAGELQKLKPLVTYEEDKQSLYYVDIPTPACIGEDGGSFQSVGRFPTKTEAIAFAREHFGADEEGRVCLISG